MIFCFFKASDRHRRVPWTDEAVLRSIIVRRTADHLAVEADARSMVTRPFPNIQAAAVELEM